MEKDFLPSEKYTQEEIDDMKVPYAFQDACIDPMCDYRACVNSSRYNFLPGFGWVGPCNQLYDRWVVCQSNREFEIKEKRRISLKVIEESGQRMSMNLN